MSRVDSFAYKTNVKIFQFCEIELFRKQSFEHKKRVVVS